MEAVKRGFTVVELLVVIAIVVVLLFTLIPILGTAKEAAWGVSCQGNLRQMSIGWESVVLERDGAIPRTFTSGTNQWDESLLKAVGLALPPTGAAIACPVANVRYGDIPSRPTTYAVNPLWKVNQPAGSNEGQAWGNLISPATYPLFLDAWAIESLSPPLLFRYFGVDPGRSWRIGFIHPENVVNIAYGDGHVDTKNRNALLSRTDTLGRPLWFFNRDPLDGIAMLP